MTPPLNLTPLRLSSCNRLHLLLILSLLIPSFYHDTFVFGHEFNFEVERRILDRLETYMSEPVKINKFYADLLETKFFDNDLQAPDRDDWFKIAFNLEHDLLYYALENGICIGDFVVSPVYREPGNSGYSVDDMSMKKHFKSCIDESGKRIECRLKPGDMYIEGCSSAGCPLEPCVGYETASVKCDQIDSLSESLARDECYKQIKYCRSYTIQTTEEEEELGFIPLNYFCQSDTGDFTQELGAVARGGGGTKQDGNCYFQDGETVVNRDLAGEYAYCADVGRQNVEDPTSKMICDDTFKGAYMAKNYDARYRPWYINTKAQQKPNWTPPYPYFSVVGMGITHAHPIYYNENGKKVFAGVLGVDYSLKDITQFLVENYGSEDSSTSIVIYEAEEPHYVIGTSTGSESTIKVRADNHTLPCPIQDDKNEEQLIECVPIRVMMEELSGHPIDNVLVRSFLQHKEKGYPKELLSVRESDTDITSNIYVSQSSLYEQVDSNLKWRVIITSPGVKATSDAITIHETPIIIFVLCFLSSLGFIICMVFLGMFVRKRKERVILLHDWWFTSFFIIGCGLVNVASLTLIGQNTNTTCVARMWSFHLTLACVLSPLFVKVWRMNWIIVQAERMKRVTMSNYQAALRTLPMILLQVLILTIFTIIDPPKETEIMESSGASIVQHVVCQSETNYFFIVEMVFESSFIAIGCILAYKTRDLDSQIGEPKQLLLAMYNIALVGVIVVILIKFADVGDNGRSMLRAIGVFWGSVISSGAFVVPLMIQLRQEKQKSRNRRRLTSMLGSGQVVSGLQNASEQSDRFVAGPAEQSGPFHVSTKGRFPPVTIPAGGGDENHNRHDKSSTSDSELEPGQFPDGIPQITRR